MNSIYVLILYEIAGPYALEIFNKEFQVPLTNLMNCIPSMDFNGGHPDPNLT